MGRNTAPMRDQVGSYTAMVKDNFDKPTMPTEKPSDSLLIDDKDRLKLKTPQKTSLITYYSKGKKKFLNNLNHPTGQKSGPGIFLPTLKGKWIEDQHLIETN